jgi:hypothetical protein
VSSSQGLGGNKRTEFHPSITAPFPAGNVPWETVLAKSAVCQLHTTFSSFLPPQFRKEQDIGIKIQ